MSAMGTVPLQLRAAAALELRRRHALPSINPILKALPALTPLQQEIVDSPASRKIVACGRRIGKTMLAAYLATRALIEGKRVEYWSASDKQTDAFWERVKKFTAAADRYKNETRRILRIGDGQLQARTGSDPDMLRSDYADLLLIDEAALLPGDIWHTVGSPMLLDTHGTAYLFSTPKRKNWFFLLYQKALADTTGRYAAWNAPTYSNPHLSKQDIDDLVADMGQDMYKQEILAEFLESGGEVFRNVTNCATITERPVPYEGQFVAGLDWAQKRDYTVLTVMDRAKRQMVDLDRFNGVDWSLQRGRVKAMIDKWKIGRVLAESNSIGGPNIEALQAEGLPIYPFETTAQSKPPLIENLALGLERGELAIFDDPVLIGELAAYERKVSPATGRSQFSAPEGLNDDCVISLALAWRATMYGGAAFSFA